MIVTYTIYRTHREQKNPIQEFELKFHRGANVCKQNHS